MRTMLKSDNEATSPEEPRSIISWDVATLENPSVPLKRINQYCDYMMSSEGGNAGKCPIMSPVSIMNVRGRHTD